MPADLLQDALPQSLTLVAWVCKMAYGQLPSTISSYTEMQYGLSLKEQTDILKSQHSICIFCRQETRLS